MLIYSKKLIQEINECYPDYYKLHELTKQGSPFIGRILYDSFNNKIDLDTILSATSLEELQSFARIEKRKVDLYKLWREEELSNRNSI